MLELPGLVKLEDFKGDSSKYIEAVYSFFKEDFVIKRIFYTGLVVNYIKDPIYKGKEFTFWHMISEGEIEEERTPDIRRCERIKWPKSIIENSNDEQVKVWANERKNKKGKIQKRICFCYGKWEYLVVISKRSGYLLFTTAYPLSGNKKWKTQKEYEGYIKKQTPPF